MGLSRTSLLTLLFVGSAVGAAAPAWSRIIDGAPVKSSEYPEVFSVSYSYPRGPKFNLATLCTATLIAPRILLTAAHCLPIDSASLSGVSPVLVSNESLSSDLTHAAVAVRTFRHPDFNPGDEELAQASVDFGVILLSDPVSGVLPTQLGSLESKSDRDSAFTGNLTVVGYGGRRTFYQDLTTGLKRFAVARMLETTAKIFTTEGPTGGLSHGDFGGPAFTAGGAGTRKLLGVASTLPRQGRTLRNGRPDVSIYAGIRPEILTWIESVTGEKELAETPPDLESVTSSLDTGFED